MCVRPGLVDQILFSAFLNKPWGTQSQKCYNDSSFLNGRAFKPLWFLFMWVEIIIADFRKAKLNEEKCEQIEVLLLKVLGAYEFRAPGAHRQKGVWRFGGWGGSGFRAFKGLSDSDLGFQRLWFVGVRYLGFIGLGLWVVEVWGFR